MPLPARFLACAGVLAALHRALERSTLEENVVFQVDSMLVARQLQPFGLGKFACRSETLGPVFLRKTCALS